jgi:predicted PurR-regulated permease PerM
VSPSPGVDDASAQRLRQDPIPRPLLILLGLGAVTLVVAGLREGAWLIAPAALGVVLVVVVAPVRGMLERRGVPTWGGILVTLFLVYLILFVLVFSIVAAGAKLADLVGQYTSEMNDLVDGATSKLSALGLQKDQIEQAASHLDVSKLASALTGVASDLVGVLSNLVFIGILVLFIGVDSSKFPRNLFRAHDERPGIVDALTAFATGTRTYLVVSAIFGAIVAAIDTVVLALLGIPGAAVWGVLAFVTNFIPNIGFVIGVIPPAIVGLLEGGPSLMVAVIVLYSVINFVIQSLIQPKFQADALGLTTTLTFLSLVFWAWVLGPLGAILALPLTLLLKALLVDVDPRARWLSPLISGIPLPEDDDGDGDGEVGLDPAPAVGSPPPPAPDAGPAPATSTAPAAETPLAAPPTEPTG